MTMFPAHQNLSSHTLNISNYVNDDDKFSGPMNDRLLKGYEGGFSSTEDYYCYSRLGSDLVLQVNQMAEDHESRLTDSSTAVNANINEAGGTSSKDFQDDEDQDDDKDHEEEEEEEGWLQLSIGGRRHPKINSSLMMINQAKQHQTPARDHNNLIELDLLTPGSTSTSTSTTSTSVGSYSQHQQQQQQQQAMMRSLAPVFHQMPAARPLTNYTTTSTVVNYSSTTPNLLQLQHYPPPFPHHHHHQDTTSNNYWPGFRQPISRNITASSSSFSSLAPPPPGYYYSGPPPPPLQLRAGVEVEAAAAGPSLDFRVVDPPRRPHSGIWFMLQASQIQAKEPFLPQIPKSYLRIKDGRMTVRLVMKYLVNKLRLDCESEIEITCRGQQLLPFLTLQHVRDNVWTSNTNTTTTTTTTTGRPEGSVSNLIPVLQPSITTTDHLMLLHYGWSSTA